MDTSAPKQLIMEPFNFSTALERNLSASWFRDIPTITVNAKFENLSVSIFFAMFNYASAVCPNTSVHTYSNIIM